MIWSNIFNVINWPPNKWKYPFIIVYAAKTHALVQGGR